MVTAKKAITTKAPVKAPIKTPAAKKPAATKTVKPTAPVEAKPALVPAKAAPKAAAKTKTPAKNKVAPAAKAAVVSLEQRNHYVQVAAFYIAERRGFAPANPAEDWAAAENEIDRLIASGQFAR
jgi:hypothetical protein